MREPKKVLIVDDEQDIREGVKYRLIAAGYVPLTAESGQKGIESAQTERPDAILLDVLMQGMDGIETLNQLRIDETTSNIPVIMLSASLRDELRALDAGAKFFLQKPYDALQLITALDSVIEEPVATA